MQLVQEQSAPDSVIQLLIMPKWIYLLSWVLKEACQRPALVLTTDKRTVAELWAGFFQVVQRANNLMFYMTKAKDVMPAAEYKSVIAEAKVLRAMAYWHLITYFGDVPFFTAPPATPDEIYNFTRTNKKTIIDFLLTDLEGAANDWPGTLHNLEG